MAQTIDDQFKLIRNLYQTLSQKFDADLTLTYKGTSGGVTLPYCLRIGNRESNGATPDVVLNALIVSLREELANEVKSTENKVERLKSALHSLSPN
jgi:hypothetical protein